MKRKEPSNLDRAIRTYHGITSSKQHTDQLTNRLHKMLEQLTPEEFKAYADATT